MERAPAFLAVLHPAAVHLPIALWSFGALFVLIGVVVPSWGRQVPLACLIGGAIASIPSLLTGAWTAEENGYPGWDDFDWSETVVRHRWMAVCCVASAVVASILAIVAGARRSRFLGILWRLGLLGLAALVAFAGHLGGEISHGEGFFEDALRAWLHPDG